MTSHSATEQGSSVDVAEYHDIVSLSREDVFLEVFVNCIAKTASSLDSQVSLPGGAELGGVEEAVKYPISEFNPWQGLQSTKYLHYLMSYSEVGRYSIKEKNSTEIAILECGIRNGGGLAMWVNYVAQYRQLKGVDSIDLLLRGIDIDPDCEVLGNFFNVDILSQEDVSSLLAYAAAAPSFDIIIDDASHEPSLTFLTWQILSQKLKNGGSYVIEDMHATDHPDMIKLDNDGYEDTRAIYIEKILHDAMFVQKDINRIIVAPRIITIMKSNENSDNTLYENSLNFLDTPALKYLFRVFKTKVWAILDLAEEEFPFRAIELVLTEDKIQCMLIQNFWFALKTPEEKQYITFDKKLELGHLKLNDHKKDTIMTKEASE